MSIQVRDVPFGIRLLQSITDKCCPRLRINRDLCYRASVLFLTYIAYMCYHLSRKPISVVKNVLHQNTQNNTPQLTHLAQITQSNPNKWRDWAPFDGSDENAAHLLGTLDSAFLFAYAIAMFFSGFIAERINLRYFLSIGMIGSGIFCYLFGIARTYEIHSFSYFVFVQIAAGVFQTTGWPGVLAILGKWFGKTKRGLLFGIWNSHTSVGNILGSLIAGEYVEDDWGLCFIVPGLIIAIVGFMLFLFLVTEPADVGCTVPEHRNNQDSSLVGRPNRNSKTINYAGSDDNISSDVDDTEILIGEQDLLLNSYNDYYSEVQRRLTERTPILRHQGSSSSDSVQPEKAIGFIGACRIPGVIEFSLSLFFAKLVSYTFLYWLPLYISSSTTLGAKYSADISTLFDVGGIVGAIVAGVISDQTGMSATTCVGMLLAAAPSMLVYQKFGTHDLATNMFLLIIVGVLVNGPYALITTAVSAELGTHSSLEGNQKALATVTAIIDGTGSIGAAVGPLLAAFVSSYGWHNVFYMLIVSDLLALLLLLRLFKHEVQKFKEQRRLA